MVSPFLFVIKYYLDLTKFGIVIFVLMAGIVGYATGFQVETAFSIDHALRFLGGLYLLSSGSLALNQVQEFELDRKMKRTAGRPIAAGKIQPNAGAVLALTFIFSGAYELSLCSSLAGWIGLLSVGLYNGLYTKWWKRQWAYAAVPGAIPGALPVTIGFAAVNEHVFSVESIYLFLIMFLWQMPHFWVLAIRHKDDYARGGIPTLPVSKGIDTTLYQIGLYTFAYVGVALCSPWLFRASWLYIALVVPFALMVLFEFRKYFRSRSEQNWLRFFLWTNFSMIVFIAVPVVDKWNFLFTKTN